MILVLSIAKPQVGITKLSAKSGVFLAEILVLFTIVSHPVHDFRVIDSCLKFDIAGFESGASRPFFLGKSKLWLLRFTYF